MLLSITLPKLHLPHPNVSTANVLQLLVAFKCAGLWEWRHVERYFEGQRSGGHFGTYKELIYTFYESQSTLPRLNPSTLFEPQLKYI